MTVYVLGNCQAQYLAGLLKPVMGRVIVLGLKYQQLPKQPSPPAYLYHYEVKDHVAAGGDRDGSPQILMVQETSGGQFQDLAGTLSGPFDHVCRIPYVHQRAPWPKLRQDRGQTVNARTIARTAHYERAEFKATMARCGAPHFDADAFTGTLAQRLSLYHPGHPDGATYARVLAAIGPALGEVAPLVGWEAMLGALAAGPGMSFGCLHPVSEEAVEALDLQWGRSDAYRTWQASGRRVAPQRMGLDAAADDDAPDTDDETGTSPVPLSLVEEGRAVLPAAAHLYGEAVAAHMRAAVGAAARSAGEIELAAQEEVAACEALDHPIRLVRRAARTTMAAGRVDLFERLLRGAAPVMDAADPWPSMLRPMMAMAQRRKPGRLALARLRAVLPPAVLSEGAQPAPPRNAQRRPETAQKSVS